ncbi:MAG: thioredoxin family protein [Saprospiraceae bacterium]
MKNLGIFLVAVIGMSLFSCTPQKVTTSRKTTSKQKTVKFITGKTIDHVLDLSKRKKKIVFIDFYIDACAPCLLMDQEAFTDRSVYQFYNKNFVNFKVDAIDFDYVNLAMKYNVQEYPTLIFLDEKGNVLHKHYGAASAVKLLELGKMAMDSNVM